jgi:transcriptional regulator with XRE-family HTH domain
VRVPKTLGGLIKDKRDMLGVSAAQAARDGGLSTAYLLKLEADGVKRPSPFILHKVATALALPYEELMRVAGYLVKSTTPTLDPENAALFADLDEADLQHVARYIHWYREEKKRSVTVPEKKRAVGKK